MNASEVNDDSARWNLVAIRLLGRCPDSVQEEFSLLMQAIQAASVGVCHPEAAGLSLGTIAKQMSRLRYELDREASFRSGPPINMTATEWAAIRTQARRDLEGK